MNCGERFHAGERISTGFVESAVNQIVDKRMDKRQSMRWTPRGAPLLPPPVGAGHRGHADGDGLARRSPLHPGTPALRGGIVTDARTDDSFQKLMQRKDFSDFINKLYSQQ